MDFSLNTDQKDLRERIIRFAREQLNQGVIERDREQIFPRDLWHKCAGQGLLGLPAPPEYGGLGLDPLSTALALEALGYGCQDAGLVFSIAAHLFTGVVPICKHGSPEQKRRYLPGLCNGSRIGISAMTEPATGSDAFALSTRAVPDGGGFRLNGSKRFIANVPSAELVIIYAVTDAEKGYHGGVSAFLLEKGWAGFRARAPYDKMGLRSSELGDLVLDDVRVPAEALLGAPGAGASIFNHAMDWERVCLLASHVGTMERLLEKSIEYVRARRQFGEAIGKFQAISHRIADMKVRLEAAHLLVCRAAANLEKLRTVSLDAAIAKLFVSESYIQTALDAVQIHGAVGYLTENHLERSVRDSAASTIYSGTSEMQRNIIARWLGL